MRLPCGLIGPSIFFFNWNRVVFSGVFTDSDSPFIKQMHASFCHFGLPWHAVGSGYEYTVSKGSDCGHCALVLPFGTYWFRRCNKSPHMDQLPKKKKTQKTKQNNRKRSWKGKKKEMRNCVFQTNIILSLQKRNYLVLCKQRGSLSFRKIYCYTYTHVYSYITWV